MTVGVLSTEFERRLARTREQMKKQGGSMFCSFIAMNISWDIHFIIQISVQSIVLKNLHMFFFIPLEGEIQAFLGNLNRFQRKRSHG